MSGSLSQGQQGKACLSSSLRSFQGSNDEMAESEERFILTSVEAVCRHCSKLDALPHVVHLIQAFTENISEHALVNVIKQGKTHLFTRVLHAVDESLNIVYHEKLRQYRVAMEWVPHRFRLEDGELDALKGLYERYPCALDSAVIAAITKMAELPILKWLHELKRSKSKVKSKFIASIEDDIFEKASRKGREDVASRSSLA
ncbi:hypothetical protein PHYPSEUDO_007867 [Phytophthora pseudosyringae]|uniref:Uncharacterized protein n=1 Tax=Phytophthora pseudosyringae TaxID=221518 RepID=A0A8T1VKS0_9STRA|nr:hypothetical protein PHYPSEUDO_007867 [Phytophthora pseudosyringae]